MKSCLQCDRPAQYSICCILSTVGRAERKQQCTKTVSLCAECLQQAVTSGHIKSLVALQESLRRAWDALTARLTCGSSIELHQRLDITATAFVSKEARSCTESRAHKREQTG